MNEIWIFIEKELLRIRDELMSVEESGQKAAKTVELD